MAATLANEMGPPAVKAASGGLDPEGRILPGALTALREAGLDTSDLVPARASRARLEAADVVVAIELQPDEAAVLAELEVESWDVASPEGGQLAAFRRARDELGLRVRELLRRHGVDLDEAIGPFD